MNKYFEITNYNYGDIMSTFILDLYEKQKYNNILIIRSLTTGNFLDKLFQNNQNIINLIYYTPKTPINSYIKKFYNKKKIII